MDLTVSIKLPEGLLGKGAVRDALTSQPIHLAVTGTLKSPKLRVSGEQGILRSFGNLLDSTGKAQGQETPGEFSDALTDVIGEVWNLTKERRKLKQPESSSSGEGQQLDPNTGRTPLLPRFRDKSRGRGLFPRRGKAGESAAPNTAPNAGREVPQPPAPASPSASIPTPI